jgi:hypothetical protein
VILRLIIFSLFTAASVWGSGYTEPIRKAASYLNGRGEKLSFEAVLSLEILQRNYSILVDTQAAKKRLLRNPPGKFRPFLRVLDRSMTLTSLEISIVRGWRGMIAKTVHCDIYPLSWDFFPNVRKLSARHDGEILAGILVLAFATWMPCDLDQQRLKAEKENLAQKIPELLNRAEPGSRLWIDALQALFQADKAAWIKREHLQLLCKLQLPDGSWKNNDLLTAKALSILLQAAEIDTLEKTKPRMLKLLPKANPSVS